MTALLPRLLLTALLLAAGSASAAPAAKPV